MSYKATDPILRIFKRLEIEPDGCWIFTGGKKYGYGQLRIGSRAKGVRTERWAQVHRLIYEHFRGPIPEGKEMDHRCRNRACCNPWCVEPCTRRENLLAPGSLWPGKKNGEKTHCKRGHPFDEQNTRRTKMGSRQCRRCFALHATRYRTIRALNGEKL